MYRIACRWPRATPNARVAENAALEPISDLPALLTFRVNDQTDHARAEEEEEEEEIHRRSVLVINE